MIYFVNPNPPSSEGFLFTTNRYLLFFRKNYNEIMCYY